MIWAKRIAAAAGALLIWALLTFAFISKDRLCNGIIERLAQEKVTLCYDRRTTSMTGCEMRFVTLLFVHSPVAKIKAFSATPWKIVADGIRLEGMAADAFPPRIERVTILPLGGTISAEGDFGTLRGTFSLSKRHLSLQITPSSLMQRNYRSTLRMFKQKNGKFVYETAF